MDCGRHSAPGIFLCGTRVKFAGGWEFVLEILRPLLSISTSFERIDTCLQRADQNQIQAHRPLPAAAKIGGQFPTPSAHLSLIAGVQFAISRHGPEKPPATSEHQFQCASTLSSPLFAKSAPAPALCNRSRQAKTTVFWRASVTGRSGGFAAGCTNASGLAFFIDVNCVVSKENSERPAIGAITVRQLVRS